MKYKNKEEKLAIKKYQKKKSYKKRIRDLILISKQNVPFNPRIEMSREHVEIRRAAQFGMDVEEVLDHVFNGNHKYCHELIAIAEVNLYRLYLKASQKRANNGKRTIQDKPQENQERIADQQGN